jgi:predicted ATPase
MPGTRGPGELCSTGGGRRGLHTYLVARAAATGNAMLKRIYVHNYRTFVNFEWRPPPACVLVGDNGSGKSALFDVLWLVRDMVVRGKRIDESGFPATRTAWLGEPCQVIELELEHGGEHFVYPRRSPRRARTRGRSRRSRWSSCRRRSGTGRRSRCCRARRGDGCRGEGERGNEDGERERAKAGHG